MLRAAISFFIVGIVAIVLGAYNVGGISIEIGKMLLGIFVVLALITFCASLFTGRGPPRLPT